ncbi:MAG: type I methionyl aminopeptidase [Ruminococcus bromii]|uniref:type I methionyl aminopeptidase n=1 Tax=Ruminococcus sp. YE282 TaxID=3158780 RepID=UPI000883B1C6|nr:type I methionyl aminopeptidase [Ruminococcus bromii]HCB94902.1 type I methionyl aminopeptidase [Ruminococcus sp.]MCI7212006.1 type I methionyl aminopeptidase [Ruminococcus bromii]MDD6433353.1 type I methionyl aminopeptidase [Ruminococcus bromii]MDY4085515.1 type I methionyl aminopeptidase [Ruminococcus bromii]
MVTIKTARELSKMKDACRISAEALRVAGEAVKPGVTTYEIDTIVRNYIEKQGATPSFLGYGGFPASACISVNNVVIHGIPSKKCVLREGDIVSVDVGAYYEGFHGDNAYTFPCGEVSAKAQALLDATREGLNMGIAQALVGNRIGDIGSAVQKYVEARSYSVVRDFVGHGVGAKLHEDPSVPNYGTPGRGVRLLPGMTIAIEPMINEGTFEVRVLDDKWTTVTKDGKLSAHFEHTVAITPDGPKIMTLCD